ncbi:hypothetical protein AX16_009780 [Volvariella volvacea WC 439]|nr:hypothetical protein AX16_009780 [Volvariella volvacea WC 439]
MHWGHIVFFYLVEQMHRWERFIFRFDKIFSSIRALRSISGPAPLLKEFEVSCAEAGYYPETWSWLPNDTTVTAAILPQLRGLTLLYTPFDWSSGTLRTGLTVLNLRALPNCHLPLDRILSIVAANPSLRNLSLYFENVLPAILPLSQTTLTNLQSFSIGGHYHLTQLIDTLTLPDLRALNFDIDARDAMEDIITNLLARSQSPPLAHLSIGYTSASSGPAFYIGQVFVVVSWPTLLSDLPHLKSFHIGGTPLEALAMALGSPDDESNHIDSWNCMRLETLGLRNCHTHSEGITKLVQMVEARNPGRISPNRQQQQNHPQTGAWSPTSPLSSSTALTSSTQSNSSSDSTTATYAASAATLIHPVKLKTLELHDCTTVGQDVVNWLKERVENVVCSDSTRHVHINSYTT